MFKKMSKKIGFVTALVCLCALSVFLVNCGSSSSHPTGILYVLTEAANSNGSVLGNDVSSFAIDLNTGSITLINTNASTCPTEASTSNPEPCGLPLSIVLDAAGDTAFVLDQGVPCPEVEVLTQQNGYQFQCAAGSNPPIPPAIYPYTVNSDGSLSNPGTAITWSCPANATPCNDTPVTMTRDASGQFLFVIDKGSYPSPGIADAPDPPAYASCPHVPTGPTDVCPSISVFAMASGSGSTTLTLASGSPFYLSKIPSAVSAITLTPPGSSTAEDILFVSNNVDICTQNCKAPSPNDDNTLSEYFVSSSGTLTEQSLSPYAVPSSDPVSVLAVNTNPVGESTGGIFVYVGTQPSESGSLSIFQLCTVAGEGPGEGGCLASQVNSATLLAVAATPPATGQDPTAMVADPTNNFLYVACQLSNQVYGYRISTTTGALTALTPVYQPTGSLPVGMAMQSSVKQGGEYLYVSNSNSASISGFTVSTATGGMSSPNTVISNPGPGGMATQ